MINLYKLGILLSLSIVISGVQCTSLDYKISVAGKNNSQIIDEKHQPDFSQDTIKIYKYLDSARTFLYLDANKVLSYSKVVLALSQKHQWSKGKILAYNLLSTYYLLDGSHDILRELSNETITISERLHLPFYTAHAKRFIAESHSEYRAWPQAKINYQYALKLFTDLGQDSSRAICMENLGNLYRDTKHKDQAFKYYDEAYQIFVNIGFRSGQATVLQSKGYYYVKIEEYDKAMMLYERAMQLYKEDQNFYGEINLLNDIGYLYYCDGKYDLAIETCLKALKYSKIYHSAQQTNWAHQTLGRAYKEKNMLEKAVYHSENAYYNRRKLHDDNIYRQYTTYQLIYDNKLKDSAIQQQIINEQKQVQWFLIGIMSMILAFAAFLWFNNRKLRRMNSEIKQAMIQGQTIERKRVAAELHDHLGGTLASLNWYLFGMDKKSLSEEEQKIYKRVHQMVGSAYKEVRSLSHNLMSAELEEHGLFVALKRLMSKLNDNKKIEFTFEDNGLDKRYESKIEFELYSISLELTTNIIKHSGATTAGVTIKEKQKHIQLVIWDDGEGINSTAKHGMGLHNVRNRVESLSGKINITDRKEKGTSIEIEIPNI